MANEIANTKAPQLPAALAALKTSLQATVARLPSSGGSDYLSFAKYGAWLLGKDGEAVTDKDHAAVNVMAIKTGYICWPSDDKQRSKGPLGTAAVPLGQTVDPSVLDNSLAGSWTDYVELPVRFVGGDLDGEQAVFNTNSKGGVDACRGLLDKVVARLAEGHETFVPLLSFKVDSYAHKTYGKIFFPVLDIVDWLTMDGEADAPAAAEEAPAVDKAPEPEAAPAAAEEAPAETVGAPRRRRRA